VGSIDLPEIRIADIFSGCGGMTVGLTEAAARTQTRLRYSLAVDSDAGALELYRNNFSGAVTRASDVGMLFPGEVGASPTATERKLLSDVGPIDVLVGGPPCQGHSDLNNHTRRSDPKNALYLKMARAAEILSPLLIVIENVSSVELDKGEVVQTTRDALEEMGYTVRGKVLDLRRIGVPQRRRRFVMMASRVQSIDLERILNDAATGLPGHRDRTVRWAIGDLLHSESEEIFDSASGISADNIKRIGILFKHGIYDLPNKHRPECHRDGNHSYVSMYGRLRWGRSAQTITTGFGSMGQGRFVHPQRRRTLTPHEAARLQTFPDWFSFRGAPRGLLSKVIGNAVPPLLMVHLGAAVLQKIADHKAGLLLAIRKTA
jgi:DNA (cytosine-5)-methyltransferase 1